MHQNGEKGQSGPAMISSMDLPRPFRKIKPLLHLPKVFLDQRLYLLGRLGACRTLAAVLPEKAEA
jgi:hypothetical protein